MKKMNNQYRDNYEEVENQNEQQIYEFSEYPQIKEYYSNKINTTIKKPKKIIVTEIFDKNPQSRNGLQLNKGYYKYYTESNSPNHYDQKELFYQNRIGNNNLYQMNENYNVNNNISERCYSDYNKFKTYNSHKNIFYNSCLREEYSLPTNDRVNIRKKIYRGSHTPQPFRNSYNINMNNCRNEENNNETLIENFKYYEINNIKDRNNEKYNSITRVTGYSNLIPLLRRQIFYNDSRNIDIYRNNNINKSYNHEYNERMINPSTTKEIRRVEIEKKEYNIPHINSQIKEKIKEYNSIKEQRKRKEENNKEKRKEFVIPPRKKTSEIKKASTSYTKIQKTTSTTKTNDSINAYKRRNENNQLNAKNNLTSRNNTTIGQYQYKKRTKELNSTSRNDKSSTNINLKKTNNTSSNYSQYQRKTKELNATKSSSNIGSYKYQSKINTENNFKNNDKIEYRKHTGRYKYKTDIENEILNSRKNYSQTKNVNKIEVVHQNKEKEKEKKYLQNRDNNSSSKITSYQKTTKTSISNYKNNNANDYKNSSTNKYKNSSTSNYKNNSTSNYKNNATSNYKNNSTSNYKNSSTNNYKNNATSNYKNSSTNNYKNSSTNKNNITSNYKNNNSGNYKTRNDNYSSSRLIKETKTTNTTTSKTNINNYENKRKNNSSYKRSDQNVTKNADENKSIYNKYKYKLSQKVETNISKNNNDSKNISNNGKNENVGFIESNIVENRVYELPETEIQNISSIKKMKMSMRKIALGDNYKYYERKFLLNPIDNSYTVHERRNERVIYGNVPVGENSKEIFKKKSPKAKKYRDKNNQIYQRNLNPYLKGGQNSYEMYNKYVLNNYSYNNGNKIGFQDGFENVEEINNYEQEHIYYQ
jgi:hypothetical protein